MAKSGKLYYCDCEEMCNGKRRKVGKSTYDRHRKYRDPLSAYTQDMQNFLNDNQVIVNTSSLHATNRSRVRGAGAHTTGRPNKRAQRSGDDTVGTSFQGYAGRCELIY